MGWEGRERDGRAVLNRACRQEAAPARAQAGHAAGAEPPRLSLQGSERTCIAVKPLPHIVDVIVKECPGPARVLHRRPGRQVSARTVLTGGAARLCLCACQPGRPVCFLVPSTFAAQQSAHQITPFCHPEQQQPGCLGLTRSSAPGLPGTSEAAVVAREEAAETSGADAACGTPPPLRLPELPLRPQ